MANARKSSRVSFGNVTVYEFSCAISSHTSARDGIPVRLDHVLSQTTMPLEARAPRPLMRLSPSQRVERLREFGVDEAAIEEAEVEILQELLMNTHRVILKFYERKKETSLRRGLRRMLERKPWTKSSHTNKRRVSPTSVLIPPADAATTVSVREPEAFSSIPRLSNTADHGMVVI